MDHNGGFTHLTAQFVFVVHLLQCTIQLSNQLNKNSIIAFQFSSFLFMKELILLFFPVENLATFLESLLIYFLLEGEFIFHMIHIFIFIRKAKEKLKVKVAMYYENIQITLSYLIQSINYFLVMFAMMCILKFVVQVAKKYKEGQKLCRLL